MLPLAPLVEAIEKLADRRLLPLGLAAALRRHVEGRWDAFDEGNVGLVHGDPHLENVLWDGAQVSAVLDLEWARRSYLECDLETLLSFFDHPRLFVAVEHEPRARAEDYAEAPAWLCDRYPELFAHPRLADRLGILHLSRTLTTVDESPSPAAVSPLRLAQLRAVLSGALSSIARRLRSAASSERPDHAALGDGPLRRPSARTRGRPRRADSCSPRGPGHAFTFPSGHVPTVQSLVQGAL